MIVRDADGAHMECGNRDEHLLDRCIDANHRFVGAVVHIAHDVFNRQQQTLSQLAAGMMPSEVFFGNIFELHQGHGDRVADRQSGSGAGRGREIQRTGFPWNLKIDDDIG